MATASKIRKGFKARCPICGEDDSLKIHVEDVNTLTCGSCDNEVTTDDIREVMAGWQRLLKWIDSAPPIED